MVVDGTQGRKRILQMFGYDLDFETKLSHS